MLYISDIELENFEQLKQLKGHGYKRSYDPNKVYIFRGPNGSGKSSIVAEHDPRPLVHGFPTIVSKKEGKKILIYRDSTNPSIGYKVVHFYLPKPKKKDEKGEDYESKHSVKSYLYRLHNDEIVETIVNGSPVEFRAKMKSIFDVDYESIKITTIGMKFGKSVFNILSCNDSDRYNYIKSVLSNLEEVKQRENHITLKLQYSNRRLKELKTVLGDISSMDYNTELDKIRLDIKDYETVQERLNKDLAKLNHECEALHAMSPASRNTIIEEYQIVKNLYDIVKDRPDYVSEYKATKENISYANIQSNNLKSDKSKYVAEKFSLTKNNNIFDKRSILEKIEEDIKNLERENIHDYDLEEVDKALDIMNDIHLHISMLSSNAMLSIEDFYKYKSEAHVNYTLEELTNNVSNIMYRLRNLNTESLSEHDKFIMSMDTPDADVCKNCALYLAKLDIHNKAETSNKIQKEIYTLTGELDKLNQDINTLKAIQSLFNHFDNLSIIYNNCDNAYIKPSLVSDIRKNIDNHMDLFTKIKNMKHESMRAFQLRDLYNKKKEIEAEEDLIKKIYDIDESIKNIDIQLAEFDAYISSKNEDPLMHIKEETLYKYAHNIEDTLSDLQSQIQNMNELSKKSLELVSEIESLNTQYEEIKNMHKRKAEELTRILVEKQRFDDTSNMYKNELEDNSKLSALRIALTKKIPTVLLNSYMIYVRDEANNILADIDRYSILLPTIKYENNRNEFDIPVSDYGESKSCALLSKGEESIIHLAISLPLIYMSTKYRIARFDEITSNLDKFLKPKCMEKILNLKDIIQVFMVSHDPEYDASDKVEIIQL